MTILTKVYLYRRDKWENVRRENKKWEGQNTTIYYELSADTQANTGLTFGKTSQRKSQRCIMGGDKYTSFNSIDKLKSVGFYYDRWWAGSGMTGDDSFMRCARNLSQS